jgi:RNA-directed DNA polymerase
VDELKSSGKPFQISRQEVWDAWLKVKGNQGAPGVDGQSIAAFEEDLKGNLYKVWNRIVLYVKRWLAAPLQLADGTLQERDRGTPQGSAISPVIADLFMHYAFDLWLGREFPAVDFERYADDAVIHCVSEYQARKVLAALHARMAEVGLELRFTSFLPAISKDALKKISAEIRSWRLHRWVNSDGREIAKLINPKIRGWMGYYGAFYISNLYPVLRRINTYLLRWVMNKYKNRSTWKKATRTLMEAAERRPQYFAHWAWVKPAIANEVLSRMHIDPERISRQVWQLTAGRETVS